MGSADKAGWQPPQLGIKIKEKLSIKRLLARPRDSPLWPQPIGQEGYAAFSISASHTDPLVEYIRNQPRHHISERFIDEYERLLAKNKVDYRLEYIFAELE